MPRTLRRWVGVLLSGWLLLVGAGLLAACSSAPAAPTPATPLQRWLAERPLYIAHRGGDGDWPEASAYAYAQAAAWNPELALEVPVRLTSDGVWVVSEDATTGRLFGTDLTIATTPWATLAQLRSRIGSKPLARLVDDVLDAMGRDRIIFVDNKANVDLAAFFDVLHRYGGPSRFVVKSFYQSTKVPARARALGYLTWGYYYAQNMADFAATSARFDLLGINDTAPAADLAILQATGKPVIAHIIDSAAAATAALHTGVAGLMVSAVQQAVPHAAR